ncbi:hypothetical protein [Pontibacter vulgaris]|uniref:hypothetical protein n=1 Tax=Pontibacter vulgaris TaxID=2905679 RepID=UPI001FA73621|nr:hypothetical protein [Pontibacter vulgaris]
MSKSTLNFWILFAVSLILSAIVIAVFFKILKAVLFLILILALAPVIYILLKLIMPGKKTGEGDKLKTRH